MTLNLKLVRHEDGKWKALPTDTDDLGQVSIKEKKCAPIDPDQLLKALDGLLSPEGGIKSMEDVPRLVSLMKKFSKKLVSRCVYCNVLQATQPEILSEYLTKGGWETINTWLQYAKSSTSPSFLIEMLKLCKLLPMTLERLKENNTAKVIKSLTKHENAAVKNLSTELVTLWMVIIKGTKNSELPSADKKKKKEKDKERQSKEKDRLKERSENEKKETWSVKSQDDSKSDAEPSKLKGIKRISSEKEPPKTEYYEDVKLDPEPLVPVSKKPKTDRPKTAKIYQKKFRATGLEEETPLPKKIPKKGSLTIDRGAAVAAVKNNLKLNSTPPERITEKKIKPENLLTVNESSSSKGIKLIPAKPRPSYVLHESASFMDALTSQPVVPVKRKKKTPASKAVTSPTSPTMVPPKFQFYKDTLEMSEEEDKKKEEESMETEGETDQPMDTSESSRCTTPPNTELDEVNVGMEEVADKPAQIRSILSHGRKKTKRNVRWVDDDHIKEIFYFEMDETERENVNKSQNFGDLKSIELRRERELNEMAKRQSGDKMEEKTSWWAEPILIDLPLRLVEPGCHSIEKEYERLRQEATLQEIYFSKDMVPDSPHEPDLEMIPPQEPKVIPLDEDNTLGALMDYSNYEIPVKGPPISEVISTLMKINSANAPTSTLNIPNSLPEGPLTIGLPNQPLPTDDKMNQLNVAYDPGEPMANMLGPRPPMFPIAEAMPPTMPPDWRPVEGPPQEAFFPGGPGWIMPGPMDLRPRMPGEMFRPNMMKPPIRGPRPRHLHKVPCRHFLAGGCRFAMKCTFLHPGINGPPL